MIIDEELLEYKTHNTGWVETYQYDTLLKGVQERGLNLVKENSDFIINFFENYLDVIYPFDSKSFLPNLYLYWIHYQAGYYHNKNRVESYWNHRITVAGGGVPTERPYEKVDLSNSNTEYDNHITGLLIDLSEYLEKEITWSNLPIPVKMKYFLLFVKNTFDIATYHNKRGGNWVNISSSGKYSQDIKSITSGQVLRAFYRITSFSTEPLKYTNPSLNDLYSTKELYNKLYVPLFSEIHEYLAENHSLQGLQFDIKSNTENRVFDEKSYRAEMAEVETNILNSRFAAERPIKDAENEKQAVGRCKQNSIKNREGNVVVLCVFWTVILIGCLVYPFIGG